MKNIFIILLLLLNVPKSHAQDSLFMNVASGSDCIIKATVLQVGPKIRMEEGIIFYTINAVVSESFKGALKSGDSLQIRITEYSLSLGGRGDSLNDWPEESFIHEGASLLFLLNTDSPKSLSDQKMFRPVDSLLGILVPTEQLLFYLQFNYKPH